MGHCSWLNPKPFWLKNLPSGTFASGICGQSSRSAKLFCRIMPWKMSRFHCPVLFHVSLLTAVSAAFDASSPARFHVSVRWNMMIPSWKVPRCLRVLWCLISLPFCVSSIAPRLMGSPERRLWRSTALSMNCTPQQADAKGVMYQLMQSQHPCAAPCHGLHTFLTLKRPGTEGSYSTTALASLALHAEGSQFVASPREVKRKQAN